MTSVTGFVIGILGGFFGGMVGLGGAVIMIPLMTGLAKMTQHHAHGTSLVAIVFTGLAGAITYAFHGRVDWKVAVLLAATAIPMARFGALYAHSLDERKLKHFFGWFAMSMAVLLLSRGLLPESVFAGGSWSYYAVFLLTGVATGFMSGMMGVGGGAIMIPAMVLLGGMPQHLAQGTSLLAMVPVSLTGAFTHYRLGNVEVKLAYGLAAGAVAGVYFGGSAANMLPELYLRLAFATVLIWMGTRYVRA
jgi:uncharacterized protein